MLRIMLLLFLPLSAFGQWGYESCPDEKVVDMEYNGDTMVLTIVSYDFVRSWGYYDTQTDQCVERVRKEVFAAKRVKVIEGRVVEPTPKRYEFEKDYKLQPPRDTIRLYDDSWRIHFHTDDPELILKLHSDSIRFQSIEKTDGQ